jgi:ribosomal protein L16 Arg81 hydroxylase
LRPESAVDAMRNVLTGRVSVRLYHLELLPAYRELVDEVIGAIDRAEVSAAAFCTSPGAVVPVHVDRYHNLLLQIAGTKRIEIGRFPDAQRQQDAIDRDLGSPIGGAKVLPRPILTTELRPGDGVYVPAYAFHWTENGDEPSIAVSVAWSTPSMIELGRVHQYNRRLRQLHLRPAPVGRRPAVDHAKSIVVRILDRSRRLRTDSFAS